jgi:hypothetical protein
MYNITLQYYAGPVKKIPPGFFAVPVSLIFLWSLFFVDTILPAEFTELLTEMSIRRRKIMFLESKAAAGA